MAVNDIIPIETKTGISGWRVTIEARGQFTIAQTVIVHADELPLPQYPTDHQIRYVARNKLQPVPPKPLRKSRVKLPKWTAAQERCLPVARVNSIDVDAIVARLPDAMESLIIEWNSIEPAKREAHRLTGLTVKDVERIDDSYRDHTSIVGFDAMAQTLAYTLPELNWDPSDDNSGKLWELLHAPLLRRPSKYADDTILRAAEFASPKVKAEIIFSEWIEEKSDTFELAEPVPF